MLQINNERKRSQETMESPLMDPLKKKKKKKEKHEKNANPESDASFTPYDYASVAIDKLLGMQNLFGFFL